MDTFGASRNGRNGQRCYVTVTLRLHEPRRPALQERPIGVCCCIRAWQDGDNPRQALPIHAQMPGNFQAQMRAALRVGMPQWAMAQPLNQLQLRAITRLEQGFELRLAQVTVI